MAQFASDSFTGTDGTELHTYNSAWTEHGSYSSGNLVLSDANRVRRDTTNSSTYYHSGTPASADYSVSADLTAKQANGGSSNTGVLGRINTAANTFYMARYSSTGQWDLFLANAGSFTNLGGSASGFSADTTRNVKLEMVGTAIKLYTDGSGTAAVSVTDGTISAAGKSGMRFAGSTAETNTAGMHLDNFSADDVVGAISGSLSATEAGADAASVIGDVFVQGALSATETGADTATLFGAVPIIGTLDVAETGADIAAFTGEGATPAVTGSFAATESGSDTASVTGNVYVAGQLSAVEGGLDAFAASGNIFVSGLLDATESGSDTASFTGPVSTALTAADLAAIDALIVARLGDFAAAVLAAAAATPIQADIRKVNALTVDGAGTEADPWGPV